MKRYRLEQQLKHIESSIASCKLRGFNTKRLMDRRSDVIALMKPKRFATKPEGDDE